MDRDLPDATPDRDYDTIAEYPFGLSPADRPKVPTTMPPPGACDAHVHMVGGPGDFPLWEGRVENPAEGRDFDGWLDLFRTHLDTLGIERAVIVHSILYGDDNSVTIEAVKRLGDAARGIGLLRDDAPEAALDRLADTGIKGLRLNYVHGGVLSWEGVQRFAPMLAARDMHVQMLVNAEDHMTDLSDGLRALPCPVVIDHVGWADPARGPDAPGFAALLALVADGTAHVKLSGLYRLTDAPWEAADPLVAALAEANPERCLWGSDWPHLMLNGADMPDAGQLLDAFFRAVPDAGARQSILVDTPARLFGF